MCVCFLKSLFSLKRLEIETPLFQDKLDKHIIVILFGDEYGFDYQTGRVSNLTKPAVFIGRKSYY